MSGMSGLARRIRGFTTRRGYGEMLRFLDDVLLADLEPGAGQGPRMPAMPASEMVRFTDELLMLNHQMRERRLDDPVRLARDEAHIRQARDRAQRLAEEGAETDGTGGADDQTRPAGAAGASGGRPQRVRLHTVTTETTGGISLRRRRRQPDK